MTEGSDGEHRPPVLPERGRAARARALDALAAGRVIGVPTDTVYGLAARVDRPEALARVFDAKGRPQGLALPVLIGRGKQVLEVAAEWPHSARALGARYWPGPLTIVVPALPEIGSLLGGDGKTVGLRQPKHRTMRRLCTEAGPLAVTSANRHGEPPCTSADLVAATFGAEQVDVVLDGGACDATPSTVVDCTVSPPACVREGAIAWPWVEAALR